MTVALICSFTSFAGQGGNGGVSVVCRDNDGKILSVEILDVFEGRSLHGLDYDRQGFDSQGELQRALNELSGYPEYYSRFEKELRMVQSTVKFIHWSLELEPTTDAFPLIRKRGCNFEQLATYTQDDVLLVSKEIFDRLDELNKAALLIHETTYKLFRNRGENTSTKARLLVAHLLANNGDDKVIRTIIKGTHVIAANEFGNWLTGGVYYCRAKVNYDDQSVLIPVLVQHFPHTYQMSPVGNYMFNITIAENVALDDSVAFNGHHNVIASFRKHGADLADHTIQLSFKADTEIKAEARARETKDSFKFGCSSKMDFSLD